MVAAGKPRWQQLTALVSLSAGGTVTGFSFVPAPAADLTGPASMPIRLMALEQSARPAAADDSALRSAIVNVANYYLRLAHGKTPPAMEAIIWQHDSIDGVDHGASCAAFASLTLELAAQVTGQQSWVTGGTTYPWPLHKWADVRVDPNPASPDIVSVLQDAQAHHRWHPLGDGYHPLPGDWVLFDGHVEVVTKYAAGTLYTIGGDSLPNYSVNAHQYPGPLAAQGVAGFVNNGSLARAAASMSAGPAQAAAAGAAGQAPARDAVQGPAAAASGQPAIPGTTAPRSRPAARAPATPYRARAAAGRVSAAAIPGMPAPANRPDDIARRHLSHPPRTGHALRDADVAGARTPAQPAAIPGVSEPGRRPPAEGAAIPGLPTFPRQPATGAASAAASPYRRHRPTPPPAPASNSAAQQAFIDQVAPGAIATQRRYGVPAAVTIAQAIDESSWGQSELAVKDHNLFGIKGTGPAGSDALSTQEYQNGQWISISSPFRVYHNVAESIDDHAELLATSGYYTQAMAARSDPEAFANALTGVYATNPNYGSQLIQIMRQYGLYAYDRRPLEAGHSPRATRNARPSVAAPTSPGSATAPAVPRSAFGHRPHRPHQPRRPQAAWASIPGAGSSATSPDVAGPARRPAARPPARPRRKTPTPASAPSPAPEATLSAAYRPMPPVPPAPASSRATPATGQQPRKAPFHHNHPGRPGWQAHLPASVKDAFVRRAKAPITRTELLYRDVASQCGIPWQMLAACDWMQCEARPRYSPVHGEKLGSVNADGTVYRTKSEALGQCAVELAELARAVYGIDLRAPVPLSVADLANAFAAFRWGGLLRLHRTSAMEFPYSVAGLSAQHLNMRWPSIAADAPDKPGARFREPFGAVPVVLSLNYPATA